VRRWKSSASGVVLGGHGSLKIILNFQELRQVLTGFSATTHICTNELEPFANVVIEA
jgi:hypothetical protein